MLGPDGSDAMAAFGVACSAATASRSRTLRRALAVLHGRLSRVTKMGELPNYPDTSMKAKGA